jgi:hypothetical protein
MDRNDQQAIEGLFSKLATVERQAGPRDADADQFIQDRVNQHPGAPYFMAQTIVVQEQALEAAQRRIEELEYQTANSQPQRGGLLSGLFGGSSQPQPRTSGNRQATQPSPWGQSTNAMPMQGRAGGGFLAGAAQTAMGVAGGVLLGNAIMGMFGGDEAQAADAAPAEEPAEDDGGGDFEM